MTEKHAETNETIVKMQGFWERFQKPILIGLVVLIVGVGGWYGYNEYILKPKEEKAAEALFKAQQFFAMDSSNLVLNGDGQSKGVLYVMKTYSGTHAANLSKYYAGVSYLKLGDFNNAVKYLKDFSTTAKQIQLLAYGCLGDAYSELNNKEEAVANYKKAAAAFDKDEANSAEYLFRAALLQESTGKTQEAVALYEELKEKFPKTEKGFQADKYINRLSLGKN